MLNESPQARTTQGRDPVGELSSRPVPGPRPTRDADDPALPGRERELTQLRGLLEDAARGQGRALVIHGGPGAGKTALLRELGSMASPAFTILRASGAPGETGLAFATLHQLCMPVLDEARGLPEPQQDALLTALGMRSGIRPDPFLVGLATVGILSRVAERSAVLCVIDDAHWMDAESANAVGFVARRMGALSVGLVLAMRAGAGAVLPEVGVLELGGLPIPDARRLFRRAVTGPLDSRVETRALSETRGNPGMLIEFGRAVGPLGLAGGFRVPRLDATPGDAEAALRHVAGLGPQERLVVTVAAADPTGDRELLIAAARRLGIAPDLIESEDIAGVIDATGPVVFRSPFLRSALYHAAPPAMRRDAHGALADVVTDDRDADWRAWHRALAVPGEDAAIAAELEAAAPKAQSRGGLPAAAVFWERAAVLSDSDSQRGRRGLTAAELSHLAGDAESALRLLAVAEPRLAEEDQLERAHLLRARAAYALRLDDEIPPALRQAAERLASVDRRLARDSHVEAVAAAPVLPVLRDPVSPAPDQGSAPPAVDALVGALAALDDEFRGTAPAVAAAVARYRREVTAEDDVLRWDWLACRAAAYVWDFPSVDALSARMVELPRALGSLRALPLGLSYRMVPLVLRGELAAATALGAELRTLAPTRPALPLAAGELLARAWRGREHEAVALVHAVVEHASSGGEAIAVAAAGLARAVLYNGLGRPDLALAAAHEGAESSEGNLFTNLCLPELVEAAVRCRRPDIAARALHVLAERTGSTSGEWAHGIELRCRALVAQDDDAESLYRESIRVLEGSDVRTEHARSLLVFGEWLRRRRRRAEAREHLRAALDLFAEMGMEGFAARAQRELAAVGDSPVRAEAGHADRLTARELEVARLASEGFSNPEIGSRLFLSARTVQYHLRKVFMKLGISSRVQLADALAAGSTGWRSPAFAAKAS